MRVKSNTVKIRLFLVEFKTMSISMWSERLANSIFAITKILLNFCNVQVLCTFETFPYYKWRKEQLVQCSEKWFYFWSGCKKNSKGNFCVAFSSWIENLANQISQRNKVSVVKKKSSNKTFSIIKLVLCFWIGTKPSKPLNQLLLLHVFIEAWGLSCVR